MNRQCLCWFGVALCAAGWAFAEEPPFSADYLLRSWDTEDGLPELNVTGIAQSPDGYLWVATTKGLSRFDGARFEKSEKNDGAPISPGNVLTIFTDRDGALWISTLQKEIFRRKGDRTTKVAISPMGQVNSFAQDHEGAIWFGLGPEVAVARWQDGKLTRYTREDFEELGPGIGASVVSDRNGNIWVWTDQCGVFDGEKFRPVDQNARPPLQIAPCAKGGVWAARGGKLLRYTPAGAREELADLPWGEGTGVTTLSEDRLGDLWIGTSNKGLLRFREGEGFVRVATSHSSVTNLLPDQDGNLWVGTDGGGLDRLRPRRFFLRQVRDGLLTDTVGSVCVDAENRLWAVSRDGRPVRAKDARNRLFGETGVKDALDCTVALSASTDGSIWCARFAGNQMQWKGGAAFTLPVTAPSTAILPDSRGDLWFATIDGEVRRLRQGIDEVPRQPADLKEPRALAEDASGVVWVGTEGGRIYRWTGEEFVDVALPGAKANESIRFIVPDENATLWIGAVTTGLYRIRAGQVRLLPENAGLPTDDIRSLLIDPEGDFWIGTGTGLHRVTRAEIDAVMDGRLAAVRSLSYGREEGLPPLGFSYGFRNAATRTPDGRLWFATNRGLLEVDRANLPGATALPPVRIEAVRTAERLFPIGLTEKSVTLPPHPGPVEIQFSLPQLTAPERIRFRYRLEGLADDWMQAGFGRTASFPAIPPGTYRFEIAAADGLGPWSQKPASLTIVVRAFWWEEPWLRGMAALVGALALAGLLRLIIKRRLAARLRSLEQEHALERERIRIARDIHDELGANLTQIVIASELAPQLADAAATANSEDIARTARRTVESLDEIVWAVNPRNDTWASLLEYLGQFALGFLRGSGISCEVNFPSNVPALQLGSTPRHHLFLVAKEALNNIVRHSRARHVKLDADVADGRLHLTLADDGVGFVPDYETSTGNGLLNMRERVTELGGTLRIESHPGSGTRVTIDLPLSPTSPKVTSDRILPLFP